MYPPRKKEEVSKTGFQERDGMRMRQRAEAHDLHCSADRGLDIEVYEWRHIRVIHNRETAAYALLSDGKPWAVTHSLTDCVREFRALLAGRKHGG